jgi:hypothetical protein
MNNIERHKLILSGNKIQLFSYSLREKVKNKPRTKIILSNSDKTENRKKYLQRVRSIMDRIIWSNPDLKVFVTLTFEENLIDSKKANYLFNQFVQKYNYRNKKNHLKYIAVIEFQKRGAVHYHLLIDRFVDKKFLQKLWGNGFTRIEHARGNSNQLAGYLIKYLNKNSARDTRLWGKKMYFTSQNIQKPIVRVYDDLPDVRNAIDWYIRFNNKEIINEYYSCYDAGFIGQIEYRKIILRNRGKVPIKTFAYFPEVAAKKILKIIKNDI